MNNNSWECRRFQADSEKCNNCKKNSENFENLLRLLYIRNEDNPNWVLDRKVLIFKRFIFKIDDIVGFSIDLDVNANTVHIFVTKDSSDSLVQLHKIDNVESFLDSLENAGSKLSELVQNYKLQKILL